MSRSETSLLKLNIVFLMGLLYLQQIIGGSEAIISYFNTQ